MRYGSTRGRTLLVLALAVLWLSACNQPPLEADEANSPPDVRLIRPDEGSQVTPGGPIEIQAVASDPDGDEIELVVAVNGDALSRESSPDGEIEHFVEFTPYSKGPFEVSAQVSDEQGESATASVLLHSRSALQESFTLVVIPDTQNMIMHEGNTMVDQMTQWVVDNAEEHSIAFLTHEGDLVDEGSDEEEWIRVDRAMSRLDGRLPYSVSLGDHEYEIEENVGSSAANYVAYFGPERYRPYDWYGGSGPEGKNHYQIFEAGGLRFLHLNLEWEAQGPVSDPGSPLGWASTILEKHPGLPTIITTHAYLWDYPGQEGRTWKPDHLEGYIEDENGERIYPGSTGQDIFEALVEPYPQVFMVLNGHYHLASGETEGEYHQVSVNAADLEVFEMLADYQEYRNGGNGWLRLIEFIPGGGQGGLDRISVKTYSPVLDEYLTDPSSQFHFDLDFEARFEAELATTAKPLYPGRMISSKGFRP